MSDADDAHETEEAASLPLSPVPDDRAAGDDDVALSSDWRTDSIDAERPPVRADRGLLPELADELSALRQHVEVLQQDVAGLVARLHTLGGSLTAVETAISDRLSEYADTVVQLGRGLTSSVATYREGNDRVVADVRRAIADSEELVRAVLARVDDLTVATEATQRALSAEPAGDELDVDDLRAVVQEAVGPIDVRADLERLSAEVAALREQLHRDLSATATPAPAAPVDVAVNAQVLTVLEALQTELEQLRRGGAPAARGKAGVEQALVGELAAMREEIAALKRRIAVRAKATAIDDEQIAAIVEQVRAAIEFRLPDDELARVAEAVANRFAEAFEVVTDE